ncbi:MAG: transglutaminase domain-containing protein [Fimbriimonas sp.]|nr:transglutaminase domain-containing protein [Fimbriimonas sp.]
MVTALTIVPQRPGSRSVADPSLSAHGLGVENTYTITTVVKILRPCEPAAMTDPYQDVKVLSDDHGCLTLSITYFPLNDRVRAMRNRAYATKPGDLDRYLRPSVTCNWNPQMRNKLIGDLSKAGIRPGELKPADLVKAVARWAFQTSSFAGNSSAMPSDWYVAFDGTGPHVFAPTRNAFEQSKSDAKWKDRDVFNHQLFGRQMFERRCHGACTSSSIYIATILRALGIPTRILYFIPPCDANDPTQVKILASSISRRATRQTIIDGVQGATGFANHMFDEVWIDGRWRRLNYSDLDQEIVDGNYLGLMTHIDTCADISETHLAETWGLRTERWPKVQVRLSSINPYQLIAAKDHWGKYAVREDRAPSELTSATVIGVLWPGTADYRELIPDDSQLPKTDLFLEIKEWIANRNYMQLREFIAGADPHFILRSPGHSDVGIHYNGLNCNNSTVRGFAMNFDDAGSKLAPGVAYTLVPRNDGAPHPWRVAEGVKAVPPL